MQSYKRVTTRQARLLSTTQTVWAVFKLCGDMAYKEECDAAFWAEEDTSEFKYYIEVGTE